MVITIDVERRELRKLELVAQDVEEILWGVIAEHIDPEELVDTELNINVYD